MNINEINTVSDLVKANEEAVAGPMTKEALWAEILKTDAPTAMALCKEIVNQLACWHTDSAKNEAEAGNLQSAYLWARDEGRLYTVWQTLNDIEVG